MESGRLYMIIMSAVLLVCSPCRTAGEVVYTNHWALHITGGHQQADDVASRHGFVSLGKVTIDRVHAGNSCESLALFLSQIPDLDGYYHFFLPSQATQSPKDERTVTEKLLAEQQVIPGSEMLALVGFSVVPTETLHRTALR